MSALPDPFVDPFAALKFIREHNRPRGIRCHITPFCRGHLKQVNALAKEVVRESRPMCRGNSAKPPLVDKLGAQK
eukprot:2568377-Amphidinium_carterae.1